MAKALSRPLAATCSIDWKELQIYRELIFNQQRSVYSYLTIFSNFRINHTVFKVRFKNKGTEFIIHVYCDDTEQPSEE